jgi:hypothetical protein
MYNMSLNQSRLFWMYKFYLLWRSDILFNFAELFLVGLINSIYFAARAAK